MVQLTLRNRVDRRQHSTERGRKRGSEQLPLRIKPHLEYLEGRCLPSTVTNLNDSGAGSLRQAIIDTPAGGTVDFQAGLRGTITLTTGELLIDHNLTIAGPGSNVITVSGNNASRVFTVLSGTTVNMSALTITAGYVSGASGNGGGINSAGGLTLTDCTVSDNHGFSGSGIYNSGTLTVAGSTISGNYQALDGGGIYNAGILTVESSTLSGNDARFEAGGAIYNSRSLTVSNSTFSDNWIGGSGGGAIYNFARSTVDISGSTFSGNYSNGLGDGGAIRNGGTLTVVSSTFSGNYANSYIGGAIGNGGTLSVAYSTISGNSASQGGGIASLSGTLSLHDTIVAANSASADPDLLAMVGFASLGHNLIGDGTGGSGYDVSDLVGTAQNPIDPRLGPLADNGGPTQTMALLPGSPAIGAGDPTNAPMWDQRGPGFPRVVNGRIDIGAFEVQNSTPENPIHGGFDAFALPPCDDCSSPATSLGFTFNFFGVRRDTVWINNNGNLTFDSAFSSFLPGPVNGVGQPILAPFWADVYTNGNGLGRVTYGRGTLDGDPAFAATWENVAHYLPDGTANYFQVVLIDHAERGFQEVQFNYLTIGWDHTNSSDQAPRVGYSNGAGASSELPGSGTFDSLVDSGSQSLRLLRRYTLIVYPFTVASGFTGDFVHFSSSGSGNQPASIDLVPFGAIDHRAAMTDRQGATNASPTPSVSTRSSGDASLTHVTPEATAATDYSAILDLVLADDRLLL